MDLRPDTGDRVPPPGKGVSIPTAGQVGIRSIPAAAVGLFGLPLLGWFLTPGVGEGWWFLSALAIRLQ